MNKDASVLITGGTGSFGTKFTEIILKKYNPNKLVVFSRDELKQYQMAKKFPKKKYSSIRFFLGDVRDRDRLILAKTSDRKSEWSATPPEVPLISLTNAINC